MIFFLPFDTWNFFLEWAGVMLVGFYNLCLAASLVLGLLLVLNRLRVVEPYRFDLWMLLLLIMGFEGDSLWILGNSGLAQDAAEALSRNLMAAHVLALVGYSGMREDPPPGAVPGRFDRLGGAGVWDLARALVYLTAPSLVGALREAMQPAPYAAAFQFLLAAAVALILDHCFLATRRLAPSARAKRLAAGGLGASLMGLLLAALGRLALAKGRAGDMDGAVASSLLLAPLAFMLALHLRRIGPLSPAQDSGPLPPPPAGASLRAASDGESVTIEVLSGRGRGLLLLAGAWLLLSVNYVNYEAGTWPGSFDFWIGMLFYMGLFALAWTVASHVVNRRLIHVQGGYVRGTRALLGATPFEAPWSRRASSARYLQGFSLEQRDWFRGVFKGGVVQEALAYDDLSKLTLTLQAGSAKVNERALRLKLKVHNSLGRPITPDDLDQAGGRPAWAAEMDGRRTEAFLSQEERARAIPAGGAAELTVRILLPDSWTGAPVGVAVSCGRGAVSNTVMVGGSA